LITAPGKQDIFNRFFETDNRAPYFLIAPKIKNHLVFIHSSLGSHYYSSNRKKVSFYQLENDPMFMGQEFSSLGKHLLFILISPTNKPRMIMELTNTVVKQSLSELPKPSVQSSVLNFVGRGTGRIFSDPIMPSVLDGVNYVSIDMNRPARQFPKIKSGLMLLYGRDIAEDPRWITTFGRDISVISEKQYQALTPPAMLQHFPQDLANKNLEYSGIYEDGWISERAFFVLAPSAKDEFLIIKGFVPNIDNQSFSSELRVQINKQEVAKKKILVGDFVIKIKINPVFKKQRIDLYFDAFQKLPGIDGRIVGGKIYSIGFAK
jgi:hypothetical protein